MEGQFDKAQAELEKLGSSENSFLAKQSKKDLKDVEEKKARVEKLKQPQ